MPNHITNRLVIEGATEEVAKVFDFLKADKPDEAGKVVLVDFNKIVPMPESLEVKSSSEGDDFVEQPDGTYKWKEDDDEE